MFIYQASRHYKELWRVENRAWSGHPRSVRTETALKTVWEWLPLRKQKIMSRELNISARLMSHLIRDDLHMTAYWQLKGHLLIRALKEIRHTKTQWLLQWHTENGYENILFTDKKIFTIEEQYNHPTSWFGGGGVPSGGDTSSFFCEKGVKTGAVPKCIKRMCYKELWNLLTRPSSMVRQGSSSRTQLLPTRPRWLRSGCRGTLQSSTVPRIGPQGVHTPGPWTINCGLFWTTWLAKSVTTT